MVEEVIPVLRVANAAAAVTWFERLGFDPDGNRLRIRTPAS